ncbi:MAG TPA: phage terminase large subunit [Candidatus Limnocylindrales bacterium]|jgi:phage terminase large subunit|nr:phage terminase large subunit [Candidatus Limnocylindrales bacterium]
MIATPSAGDAVLTGLADRLLAGQRARAGLSRPEFASPEHERFFESTAPEILVSGWMGAGKSRVLCEKAWSLALAYPGAELGIFRKVRASLAATTERTFWEDVADRRYVVGRNKTEHWVDLAVPGTKPSRIWFLGLDSDPETGVASKAGSLNLDWAGVDEAIELEEADWTMLLGRLRRTRIPYRQLAAVTNPGAPTHWLKGRFTPPSADRAFVTIAENRFLTDDYRAKIASLPEGVHADRLGKGLWVAAEGTIWLLPDDQIREPDQETWKRTVGGIDWGFIHAFAAEVLAESGTGRRAVLEEIYTHDELLEDLIPEILDVQRRRGVTVWYADPSEPEYIAACRKKGIRIEPATNDVTPGLTSVATAIKKGMTVSPSCTGLLAEIPAYVWERSRSTGRQSEKPVKVNDHACDALRYANMGLDLNRGGLVVAGTVVHGPRRAERTYVDPRGAEA